MDDSQLTEKVSQGVAAWNTALTRQSPLTLPTDVCLGSTPSELLMQQQYLTTENNVSLQTHPNAGSSGSCPSHATQVTWPSGMPLALTPPVLTSYMSESQDNLRAIFSNDQGVPPHSLQPKASCLRPHSRKRGPKATTMTDQRWKPATDRIRHLWSVEKSEISRIRDTINREYGFNATERQYKLQIKKLGLQRNCTAEERQKILRRIRYRKDRLGKESNHVRVRDSLVSEEKLARWWKEQGLSKSLKVVRSPSPLPSEVSIQTSYHNSSTGTQQVFYNDLLSETHSSISSRLLEAARKSHQVIGERHARSVFNDIQQLLDTNYSMKDLHDDEFCPRLETRLLQLRNTINLQSELTVGSEIDSLPSNNIVKLCRPNHSIITNRDVEFSTSNTKHGQLELFFWMSNAEGTVNKGEAGKADQSVSASSAKISLYTNSDTGTPIRVSFSFNQADTIPMKLTYQAMIPNNSEVWKIIEAGDVEALRKALVMQKASLTDHDENGRSLLSYAATFARPDMCKFLLSHGADPNAFQWEVTRLYMGPIHAHYNINYSEQDKESVRNTTQCQKVMLEFGADPSLKMWFNEPQESIYEDILSHYPCATLEAVLLLSKPFITLNTKVPRYANRKEISPLLSLADICRYPFIETFEVIEKGILLLRLGADVKYLDERNNNILHCILQSKSAPAYEQREIQAEQLMKLFCDCDRCNAPFREPGQLLEAAISKGADIYAINEWGETPTMTARLYDRDKEWAKALEECGIVIDEVIFHTELWKRVLDALEDKYLNYSPEEKAKIIEGFNSSFWNSENIRQKPSLSFEQFCWRRNQRRKQQVDCDADSSLHNDAIVYRHLRSHVEYDDSSHSESSEEQFEESSEVSMDNGEVTSSHIDDGLSKQPSAELFEPNRSFTGVVQNHNHDEIFSIFDQPTLPVGSDDVDPGIINSEYRDIDTCWNDDWQLGTFDVGTLATEPLELMDLNMPDVYADESFFQLGAPCGEESLMDIDELLNLDAN